MVLDALASYVGDLLKQVAEEELGLLLGVPGEIDKMGDKLRDLKNFLADADRRNITDETVREWVGQLKRAMYEATDILDLCQLKAMEHGPSTVDVGCFNPLLFCMRNPLHAHELGTRIKELNQRLDDIKDRSGAFNFIRSYEDHSSKVQASRHGNSSRETTGDFDGSAVVGEKIEEDTRALVAQIMRTGEEVNNIMVVTIVGAGGIGKTTLAQKVFNDEAIQGNFSKKIWLSVNQNFCDAELLRRAIIEVGGDHQPAGDAKVALNRTLKEALLGHKTLLVMDDVWDHGAWEGVLKTPLVNVVASGSRVLITTRDEDVARGMMATCPYHRVEKLAPDDAWLLLKKQVLSSETDEDHINTLKDIGLKIIKKCGGLPLAIKVMGGLLRKRGELRRDWERVLNDSKWSATGMPKELDYAIYLSYEDMHPYLKQCFLYYSFLPKNKIFNQYEVVAMWISEGFIHGNSNDLEELGGDYYKELISRNLIEPDKSHLNDRYCKMHDVIRSFSHYMTRDEALVANEGHSGILTEAQSQKFLRLSIERNQMQSGELEWKALQGQQSVRTLILTIQINVKPGDSLVMFSSLRILYIESADVAALVESLHQLKHLRYLTLADTSISVLPGSIGKMKLLQYLELHGCKKLGNLPASIVKLGQLRLLHLPNKSMVPRGFHCLTSMRRLAGFRAHMEDNWCSLDELGPLSQLKLLELNQLENVSAVSFAANARLGDKMHLVDLFFNCTSKLGDDGLIKEKEGISEEEQRQIEKVFDQLCPPPSVENMNISGYFGQQLPIWMMSRPMAPLNNLKVLIFSDLACCTELPSGLCQLPYLQLIQVSRAPCIRRVGIGFLQAASAPFPRLNKMILGGMVEWEEWEWEELVQAMPRLEELFLINCKLRCVPPGLSSNARILKKIVLQDVCHLRYLENFPSIVELIVIGSFNLERITNLPKLQKLTITKCQKLKVLESIPALERLVLEDYTMEKLPDYMRGITPRHLQLNCRLWLLSLLSIGQSGTEWDKFNHVEHVKAYAGDGNNTKKWYVLYTRRDDFKLDSNISSSTVLKEPLSSCMVDAQGFESMYQMSQSTFSYVCSLVRVPFLEDMMARDHTFLDGRVLSLQDQVAVALRVLNSGEPPVTVGSSVGVNESTISLVTQRFVEAMPARAYQHLRWPRYGYAKMKEIKRKFDEIHGLPNCCGVVHTTHIKFGSTDRDHEENDGVLMQVVIDTDMRFTNLWLGPLGSDSMMQSSTLHTSPLFKECENGGLLNGSKLYLSDGWQVGEYIIGGSEYPLRPWLLTPYQLEQDLSLLDSKEEFNRRHSAGIAIAQSALARLRNTWKCLQGGGWHPNNQREMHQTISTCCRLHNIVIGIEEEEEGARIMRMLVGGIYSNQVRQIGEEDAVRMRDALSQYLIESRETLSSTMVGTQEFEHVYKMRRSTFSYVCSLVKVPFFEDMMARNHTFVDGRRLSLQDQVAVALRVLNSGEPLVTIGSSLGVNEPTVLLVTQRFVKAMFGRVVLHHARWPHSSSEMEKIKGKFDKIHGLPNCCGIVHTAHIKFGSKSRDHEDNDDILLQTIVDPDMRFTDIWVGPSVRQNQCSFLQDSDPFKECEQGVTLNGSKLKLSSGVAMEVGEYIIGDAGYSLRPWLLTPYQLEGDLSDSDYKKEFNKRHSEATAVVVQKALSRLNDTWKCLQGEGWNPSDEFDQLTIGTCCILHNIVIDMEEEGAGMQTDQEQNKTGHVRKIVDEDALKVRDVLAQYLMEYGVHAIAAEEAHQQLPAASSSGDENKDQAEAFRRQKTDRGKEKVQDL